MPEYKIPEIPHNCERGMLRIPRQDYELQRSDDPGVDEDHLVGAIKVLLEEVEILKDKVSYRDAFIDHLRESVKWYLERKDDLSWLDQSIKIWFKEEI